MRNFFWLFIFFSTYAFGQTNKTVVIGTMTSRPNAVLVLNPPDGNQGFLVPQLSSTQRQSFKPQSPAEYGLMVFDTTEGAFFYWGTTGWIRGLGNESTPIFAYDAATYKLRFNSSEVDLSSLKEIPSLVGQKGNILTNDGNQILWASPPAATGDVQDLSLLGNTLTLTNDATAVNLGSIILSGTNITDGSINSLDIASGAVTPAKVSPGANNTILTTDGAGAVIWAAPSVSTDAQDLTLTGSILNLTNDGTSVNLSTLNWAGTNIIDGSLAELDLANGAVSPSKVTPGGNNTVLTTDGTGTVIWASPTASADAQDLSLSGNVLSLTNDGTTVNLGSLALTGTNITDGTIAALDLASAAVTPAKVSPGANNTILTTDGTGAVVWAAPAASTDAQDLSLSGNVLSLTNDGTTVNLGSLALTGTNITDGTIAAVDLASAAVTPTKVASGAPNTVLSTDAVGTVVWSTPAVSPDAQDLSLTGNVLNLTNDGSSVDLSSIVVTGTNITDGTIATADLAGGSVTPGKVASGAANTVLTTNGVGNVIWSTPASDSDAQNLTLAANTLTLTNDASPIDLNLITANGQVIGPLNSLAVSNNSVTTAQLQNSSVTVSKLVTAGVPDAGKVYTTSATGVPQLELKGTLFTGVTAAGDLSGTYPAPSVAKIQGNNVKGGALGVPDIGKVLVWDGTQWVPSIVNGVSPVSQYVTLDPADFTNLREDDTKDKDNIIIFEDNSTYVTTIKKNEGAGLIAPLHLPHGAQLEEVTLYYLDRDSRAVEFTVYRKTPIGANQNVTTSWSSTGNIATIRSSVLTPIVGTEIIDNDAYSYRIVIRLDQTNDIVSSSDADLRVYAVKIKYLP